MTRDELIEAAWNKAGKRFYTIISREAVADVVDIVLEEAAKVATSVFPRGSAHTYSSENADLYRAQEYVGELIAERIRALKGK